MGIDIGKLIRDEVKRQKLTITKFAKLINTTRANAYGIFNRPDMNTKQLIQISKALHRNFVEEVATQTKTELGLLPEPSLVANSKLSSLVNPLRNEVEGDFFSESEFTKDREGLKAVLKEYFESDHRIPMIILEMGYTFGAREVVKQVANEVFRGIGSAPCPNVLDVNLVRSMSAKVFFDYIDQSTFDSNAACDDRLSQICRVQSDVNKKFVCVIHTDPVVTKANNDDVQTFDQWGSVKSIFHKRYEQFFIAVYRWGRNSLLSWATDVGLHEYVLNYIRKHQVPEDIRKDYQLTNAHLSFSGVVLGLPPLNRGIDYPTAQAYLPSEWKYVSDFIAAGRDLKDEWHLRYFIRDIIDFNEMDEAEYLDTRPLPMKRIDCDIEVAGVLVDGMSIYLPSMAVGALSYLHDQAMATVLKGLDEESANEQFFPWLEQHHPQLAQELIEAAEEELVHLLAEPDSDYYRDNIPHDPPHSIDSYWTIQPGLKYNIMPYNLPKWK